MCTEEAILRAYFSADADGKMPGRLAHKAGISRSTIHRHHGTVFAIKADYEGYLLHEYKLLMSKKKYDGVQIEGVFFATLIFVMMNKKFFVPILNDGAENLVREMMKVIKPRLGQYFKQEKEFEVYVGEVCVLLERWGKTELAESEFKPTLENWVYLTKNMERHLGSLK